MQTLVQLSLLSTRCKLVIIGDQIIADSNLVYYSSKNEMSKDNEAARVRELFDVIQVNLGISAEEMSRVKVRLDALHCQKKRLPIPKTS